MPEAICARIFQHTGMKLISRLCGLVILLTPVHVMAQDRFLEKITLPSGQTLVVAEGDFEARSIGSFSVRLYQAAAPADETTFFIAGLVRPRDGVIEKVTLADVDGDRQQDVVVIVRSVGTGGYLSAHAFTIERDKLVLLATEQGLPADADPVVKLRRSVQQ